MRTPRVYSETPLELVIVGGAYKSGTSLLCELIEGRGYRNPGLLTNPFEYGHGIHAGLYRTRECSLARHWNRRLATAGPREAAKIEKQLAGYLVDMTFELGPKLILKDPYMKMMALHWFRAAHSLGALKLTYLLTYRDIASVKRSWAHSKFLTYKERTVPEQFHQLISPVRSEVLTGLSVLNVATHVIRYQESTHLSRGIAT